MSLWQSYRGLTPRTRMLIGGGVMVYAILGLTLSDKAEEALGFKPTDQDKANLKNAVPKIQFVDREKN